MNESMTLMYSSFPKAFCFDTWPFFQYLRPAVCLEEQIYARVDNALLIFKEGRQRAVDCGQQAL